MQFISRIKQLHVITIAIIITLFLQSSITMATDTTNADCLEPEGNQYFELRAVEVKDVAGQNKQVIMELWGNNIEFKRV